MVPDVVRVDPLRRIFFLGDAKGIRVARYAATVERLILYGRWVVESRATTATLAIYGDPGDGVRWDHFAP
jgi:hypothetical protein